MTPFEYAYFYACAMAVTGFTIGLAEISVGDQSRGAVLTAILFWPITVPVWLLKSLWRLW